MYLHDSVQKKKILLIFNNIGLLRESTIFQELIVNYIVYLRTLNLSGSKYRDPM